MDTLTIRRARPSDLGALDALMASTFWRTLRRDYPPSVMVTAVPIIARAQPRLLKSGTYHVVEADGVIIGAGGWSMGHPAGKPPLSIVAHVRHVVTDHRRQRQGIGRRLMTHVLDEARRAGARAMACTSTRGAVGFYASLGFEYLGEVEVQLAPGITLPAVDMKLTFR
jgi:GNAT superfamily N-acetyltransferase